MSFPYENKHFHVSKDLGRTTRPQRLAGALADWKDAGGDIVELLDALDDYVEDRVLALKGCMVNSHLLCDRCAKRPTHWQPLPAPPTSEEQS